MAGIKGDFTGFTFKGTHSSTLGLTRVSGGDRYSLSLLPSLKDRIGEASGVNRTYYFGTTEGQREFEFSVAFDSLTEVNFRTLVSVFRDYTPGQLILDELPYKYYLAKLKDGFKLDYVCFLEGSARVYKGEGTLSFIAYDPMAYSRYKYLDQYNKTNIPEWADDDGNEAEWTSAIHLLTTQSTNDKVFYNLSTVNVYNPGDKEANAKIYIAGEYNGPTALYDYNCKLSIVEDSTKQLTIYGSTSMPFLCVNMGSHLILSCSAASIIYETNADGIYYKSGSNYILRSTGAEVAPFYNVRLSSLTSFIATDFFYAGNYFSLPVSDPPVEGSYDIFTLSLGNGINSTKKGKIIGIEYSYIFY